MSETGEKRPEDVGGVPHCSLEKCPSYDGKRCRLTGFRAGIVCEPAILDMRNEIVALRAQLAKGS